jgi:hypothetical protein
LQVEGHANLLDGHGGQNERPGCAVVPMPVPDPFEGGSILGAGERGTRAAQVRGRELTRRLRSLAFVGA